jgi:hypothetical protein
MMMMKKKFAYVTHILEDTPNGDDTVTFGVNTTLQRAKKSCEAFFDELNEQYPMKVEMGEEWKQVDLDGEMHYTNGPFMIQRFELDVGGAI